MEISEGNGKRKSLGSDIMVMKKDKDGYTYGFKWVTYYNVKNPSERSWGFVYNDDGFDDIMGDIAKEGKSFIAFVSPNPPKRFATLTDAKRWVESKFNISITKKRTVKRK